MTFEEHLEKYLSKEEINSLLSSLEGKSKKSIIINTNKIDDAFILSKFPLLTPHPIVKHCYIYEEDTYQLGKHIYFEQGLYYIFEPCSGLVNHFLDAKENDMVLDLCAAPGGKTSHLGIIKNNKGIIVSNEISRERSLILSSNIERMGFNNVIVTNNTIDDFRSYENYFDKIILDAPCSGSGMFRKESKMKDDWTYSKVTSLSELQKELITKTYSLLKPGGTLVYSTCSFSYEEDEEVVKYLLEKTNAKLSEFENHEFYYQSNEKIGIHLFPHLFPGEGHYICKIEKPFDPTINFINRKIKESNKFDDIKKICQVDGYIYNFENIYYLLPEYFDFKKLKIIRGGLKLGTKEKYGFEVDHALSHYLVNYPNEIELNKDELVSYIQGNSLNKNTKDGLLLVKYQGNSLGFSKSTKGRLNNKYPKGLRKNNIIY